MTDRRVCLVMKADFYMCTLILNRLSRCSSWYWWILLPSGGFSWGSKGWLLRNLLVSLGTSNADPVHDSPWRWCPYSVHFAPMPVTLFL